MNRYGSVILITVFGLICSQANAQGSRVTWCNGIASSVSADKSVAILCRRSLGEQDKTAAIEFLGSKSNGRDKVELEYFPDHMFVSDTSNIILSGIVVDDERQHARVVDVVHKTGASYRVSVSPLGLDGGNEGRHGDILFLYSQGESLIVAEFDKQLIDAELGEDSPVLLSKYKISNTGAEKIYTGVAGFLDIRGVLIDVVRQVSAGNLVFAWAKDGIEPNEFNVNKALQGSVMCLFGIDIVGDTCPSFQDFGRKEMGYGVNELFLISEKLDVIDYLAAPSGNNF
jgi:hypothetical protein